MMRKCSAHIFIILMVSTAVASKDNSKGLGVKCTTCNWIQLNECICILPYLQFLTFSVLNKISLLTTLVELMFFVFFY